MSFIQGVFCVYKNLKEKKVWGSIDDHFGKPNRKKKPSNMSRKELVSG